MSHGKANMYDLCVLFIFIGHSKKAGMYDRLFLFGHSKKAGMYDLCVLSGLFLFGHSKKGWYV